MSTPNDTVRLQNLKVTIERGRRESIQAETTLKTLKEQETALKEQVRAQGVEPENLDKAIADLDIEIQQGLSEAEKLLAPALAPAQG